MAKPYYKKSHRSWYVNLHGKSVRLGTDEQAAQFAYERLVAQAKGDYTVAELVERFLAQPRKAGTQKYYERPLRKFVKRLGGTRVADMKVFHVTETTRSDLRAIKTCFRWAENQDYIALSPLRKLRLPPATTRGDEAYLSPEQIAKLLDAIRDPDLMDVAVVMHETGCRPQEIRKVESRHFDREGRCWVIPKAEAKGGKERVVHLSDRAYEICRQRALRFPEGSFFRKRAIPWTARALCKKFEKLGCSAYCLRHSWCTEALLRGVDLATVASLMGHVNTSMVSRVYSHLQKRGAHLKEALRRATA